MLALHITNMKLFMNQLLASDIFDIFLLEQASITTANTVTIDGHFNREFYPPEEVPSEQPPEYEYSPWSTLKGLCFQLIKGKHTPLSFKFVFHLKPDIARRLLAREGLSTEDCKLRALVLTIRYDGNRTLLTTGCAYDTFVMSKVPDQIWDNTLSRYLADKEIPCEIL